jgi:hypothetical protein
VLFLRTGNAGDDNPQLNLGCPYSDARHTLGFGEGMLLDRHAYRTGQSLCRLRTQVCLMGIRTAQNANPMVRTGLAKGGEEAAMIRAASLPGAAAILSEQRATSRS